MENFIILVMPTADAQIRLRACAQSALGILCRHYLLQYPSILLADNGDHNQTTHAQADLDLRCNIHDKGLFLMYRVARCNM